MSNEALRNKYRFEGFRSLTIEERASLRDWKPVITKEERDELRVLEGEDPKVLAEQIMDITERLYMIADFLRTKGRSRPTCDEPTGDK
jgi:hypothetical protein